TRAKQTQLFRDQAMKLKPLPRCAEDRTNVTPRTQDVGKERDPSLVVDVLFVPPGMETSSPQEIYGRSTEVIVYDPTKPSQYKLLAETLHVSCLPFRKRHTGTYLFEHTGEPALRNYDGNPNGEGQNLIQ
ncbi:MAG: hypothetical protein KDD60_04545, partial [Bdellovibrionales bacterium]|nr:hypothetical protein [Bdellovibrionales bacterium]